MSAFDDGFETRAIHAGQAPDPSTGAVVVPISLATTFVQTAVGEHQGYEYARSGNPTRTALEAALASLELAPAAHGFAFASGLAASDVLMRTVFPDATGHLIVPDDAYGGTWRLASRVHAATGIEVTPVDLTDLAAVAAALRPGTRLVWCETPTNPWLRIADIASLADLAHGAGARLVVDNTFATPYLQQPLVLGADAVVHSTTKYLGGHSDVVGGFAALASGQGAWAEQVRYLQNATGAVPGPFDCYLVLRGIKTLGVRMDRHAENAAAVVDLLVTDPLVERVLYPGLPSHPGHQVASRQMRRYGGMVSFLVSEAAGGEKAAVQLVARTRLFTLAESLGAVESLIEHPARMTHASATGSPLEVDGRLVRLSVGIESIGDLLADLAQALDSIRA